MDEKTYAASILSTTFGYFIMRGNSDEEILKACQATLVGIRKAFANPELMAIAQIGEETIEKIGLRKDSQPEH